MANAFTGNPIVIDTVSSDIDIANLTYGSSSVGVFISGARLYNPTLNDKIVIKDGSGKIVMALHADATGKDVELIGSQHHLHVNSGLKMLTADQTLTTGHLEIFTK